MSFLLLQGGGTDGVATTRRIIKRADAKPLTDALTLLRETQALRGRISDEAEDARRRGRAEGLAEARRDAEEQVTLALERLSASIAEIEHSRREAIAAAAFAAVRAILGDFDDAALVDRIVGATLRRLGDEGPFTIHAALEVAPRLTARPGVDVVADPILKPTDCRIIGPDGTIVASLDIQLDALATRWGLAR